MRISRKKPVTAPKSIFLLSPAKINLFLHIASKRSDGYHNIISLMQPVSLYDDVTIELTDGEGIEVCTNNPALPSGCKNIAFTAAELFFTEYGRNLGLKVSINKRIPHGAGLGGGSSNAATVLMGLNTLLHAGLTTDKLLSLAGKIGSDVPFFILKSAAIATGTGTELQRVNLPSYQYVLVKPDFNVSTVWAYSNFNLTNKVEDNNLTYSSAELSSFCWLTESMVNDLESVTVLKHPQIDHIKEALVRAGAKGTLMSGSGSTVFGIFTDKSLGQKATVKLAKLLDKSYRVFYVEGL